MKKHRRRRSLDSDWKDQVNHVTDRSKREVMPKGEAQNLLNMMQAAESVTTPREPTSHHEDERNLPSDCFDELIQVMERVHRAVMGRLPADRDRLFSQVRFTGY